MKRGNQKRRVLNAMFLGVTFKISAERAENLQHMNLRGYGEIRLGGTTSRLLTTPRMFLDDRLRGRQLFETALHEALHACFDHRLTEAEVEAASVDITKFLGRLQSDPRWMGKPKR